MIELQHRKVGAIAVVKIIGRFDASQVHTFGEWVNENPTLRYIIVNLEGVSFIDSSGLAMLVKGLKRCRQNEGELCICKLQEPVQVIFDLTRLDKAFRIFPDEERAIEALTS